jgi:hypothetical protein
MPAEGRPGRHIGAAGAIACVGAAVGAAIGAGGGSMLAGINSANCGGPEFCC